MRRNVVLSRLRLGLGLEPGLPYNTLLLFLCRMAIKDHSKARGLGGGLAAPSCSARLTCACSAAEQSSAAQRSVEPVSVIGPARGFREDLGGAGR
jgi:hypothetical protein